MKEAKSFLDNQQMDDCLHDKTANELKLLVKTRLAMEDQFNEGRKKKSVLWGEVLKEIKEQIPTFKLTKDEVIRKFLNLSTTYKRIKDRIMSKGRTSSSWEFFDDFDEVYGTRYSINTKKDLTEPTLEHATDEEENIVEVKPARCSKCKKRKSDAAADFLGFLKEQANREQARHDEVMEIERKKLRLEEERMKVFGDLKDILKSSLKNKRI
ncbi:uncharacterized protein LOC118744802 [Rhagoletis pomonella]|uniref:uncharacterized protein LOC118744802 n=1 Tax=Rhagoletis pomonella TaxID=28610 RepID=UPI0017855B61|nr:uncharacterized protein LOC118744802 [Rhagoletis pomonella]